MVFLPGFAIAVLLSFKSDPIFVGIAYDAGGVASGPMTATFVLALAQGAASSIETANVLVDGFGIIAMVAMAPVLSIMVLGTIFRRRKVVERHHTSDDTKTVTASPSAAGDLNHDCLLAVVNRGYAEDVIDAARQAGASGATIFHGRGTGDHQAVILPIINIELQPEKEIVCLITGIDISTNVANSLLKDEQLVQNGELAVYLSPTVAMIKDLTFNSNSSAD